MPQTRLLQQFTRQVYAADRLQQIWKGLKGAQGASESLYVGFRNRDCPFDAEKVKLAACRVAFYVGDKTDVDQECTMAMKQEGIFGKNLFDALECVPDPFLLELTVKEIPDAEIIGHRFYVYDVR